VSFLLFFNWGIGSRGSGCVLASVGVLLQRPWRMSESHSTGYKLSKTSWSEHQQCITSPTVSESCRRMALRSSIHFSCHWGLLKRPLMETFRWISWL